MKLSLVLCSTILAGLGAIACSSAADPGGNGQDFIRCVKNQTVVCPCPDTLDEGTALCIEDNELGACKCRGTRPSTSTKPGTGTKPPNTQSGSLEPKCGNGEVEEGEACDDGNTESGDGCSSDCKPDGAPAEADSCPGQAVKLWQGKGVLNLAGTTEGFTPNSPASCYTSLGPDRFYAVQPSADGVLRVKGAFAAGFNAVVEVRGESCESNASPVLCEDTLSRAFERVVQVKKDHTYYIVIGGDVATNAGAYNLSLELP